MSFSHTIPIQLKKKKNSEKQVLQSRPRYVLVNLDIKITARRDWYLTYFTHDI